MSKSLTLTRLQVEAVSALFRAKEDGYSFISLDHISVELPTGKEGRRTCRATAEGHNGGYKHSWSFSSEASEMGVPGKLVLTCKIEGTAWVSSGMGCGSSLPLGRANWEWREELNQHGNVVLEQVSKKVSS